MNKVKKKGFSFIECIIALSVVLIACVTFIKIYYAGERAFLKNKARSQVAVIAQNEFEKIKNNKEGLIVEDRTEDIKGHDGVSSFKVRKKVDVDMLSSGKLFTITLEIKGPNLKWSKFSTKIFIVKK